MPLKRSGGPKRSASTDPSCCAKHFAATSTDWRLRPMWAAGSRRRSMLANEPWRTSPTGGLPRTGRTGQMQRGEVWFAATPGGDRPVLVLTRDPVADRIGAVVVAALTRTRTWPRFRARADEGRRRADGQRRQLRQHPDDRPGHIPAKSDDAPRRPDGRGVSGPPSGHRVLTPRSGISSSTAAYEKLA